MPDGPMTTVPFLASFEPRPLGIDLPSGYRAEGMFVGPGAMGLEVIVVSGPIPGAPRLREIQQGRLGRRATPVLAIALHDSDRASLCGTGADPVTIRDIERSQAERIAQKSLGCRDRHEAQRYLRTVLPRLANALPGVSNSGVFAAHELESGVPTRQDWAESCRRATTLLPSRGRTLIEGLGFTVEALPGPASVLRAGERKIAVALFLERRDQIDPPDPRFDGLSAISYALSRADQENLEFVVVQAGAILRVYPTKLSVGAARRGRTETYIELDLDLLGDVQAGYLWLLASASALLSHGSFDQILRSSEDYAANLGRRLRDRVYDDVIPKLATALVRARKLRKPTPERLRETYEMSLLVLFRLLFVAYAEDKELLPLNTNANYRSHSLKEIARRLKDAHSRAVAFGEQPFYWTEVGQLWKAVDAGNADWGVPTYDGGLFTTGQGASREAAALEEVQLSDQDFSPVLASLLLDETAEGDLGPVDFRSLGVREFGTIYEGLLESELSIAETDLAEDQKTGAVRPARAKDAVAISAGDAYVHNASGARKGSGAYYTKSFAVELLLDNALEPALLDHLARLDSIRDEREAADRFFDFRVADIAMGSGHFLVHAIDHIERRLQNYLARRPLPGVIDELERLRSAARASLGDEYDEPIEDARLLRRQIARRCICGVDLNPLAVELARLSVWIHTFVPGLPLSFLDQNLVRGNSLVGIATLEEAAEVLVGGSTELFADSAKELVGKARKPLERLARLAEATAQEVHQARKLYEEMRDAIHNEEILLTVLAASRVDNDVAGAVRSANIATNFQAGGDLFSQAVGRKAAKALDGLHPLHFPIAFPQVFLGPRAGFDVIVGNPPWEEATVEEDAFWARHSPGLRGLPQPVIEDRKKALRRERPDLVAEYDQALKAAQRMRALLTSGSYPGMGTGDPDLYKAFCWRFWRLVAPGGAIGVVLPRSVFTTAGSANWRVETLPSCESTLVICRNKDEWVFDGVNPGYTVCLASLRGAGLIREPTVSVAGVYETRDELSAGVGGGGTPIDVAELRRSDPLLCIPAVESRAALEMFRSLLRLPHFGATDRHDWRARAVSDLHATKARQDGILGSHGDTPVYNHLNIGHLQFAASEGEFMRADFQKACRYLQELRSRSSRRSDTAFSEMPAAWNHDPRTLPTLHPRIAFRDVVHASNPRKVWAALVPANTLLTNKAPYLLFPRGGLQEQAYVLAMLNSSVCDWFGHLRIGLNLNYFILDALPLPEFRGSDALALRAIELAVALATIDSQGPGLAEWSSLPGFRQTIDRDSAVAELDGIASLLYEVKDEYLGVIWNSEARLRPPLKVVKEFRKAWGRR